MQIGFKVDAYKNMNTLVHFANNGGNEFYLFVGASGELGVCIDGGAYDFFNAGTILTGVDYQVQIVRSNGVTTATLLNTGTNSTPISNAGLLTVTAAVLGQEQDADYGVFQDSQALDGYISYFRFKKIS
jgi:hypothetical protein